MYKFKPDDKIFVNPNSYLLDLFSGLSINKVYTIRSITSSTDPNIDTIHIGILNDNGNIVMHRSRFFISIEQHRRLKIERIKECM